MRRAGLAMLSLAALGGVAMAAAGAPHFIKVDNSDMLTSRVVGTDVYDPQNKSVGKIEDVIYDNNNAVKGYILSVGGVLGMDARYVAVDPATLKVKYNDTDKKWHANIDADQSQLNSAPEFKYQGRWKASSY